VARSSARMYRFYLRPQVLGLYLLPSQCAPDGETCGYGHGELVQIVQSRIAEFGRIFVVIDMDVAILLRHSNGLHMGGMTIAIVKQKHAPANKIRYLNQASSDTVPRMRTSAQGALSSLSTAEQIGRNFSAGTPHISNIASSSFLWFNLTKNLPTGSSERISAATVIT
jgi:hypothetical protein